MEKKRRGRGAGTGGPRHCRVAAAVQPATPCRQFRRPHCFATVELASMEEAQHRRPRQISVIDHRWAAPEIKLRMRRRGDISLTLERERERVCVDRKGSAAIAIVTELSPLPSQRRKLGGRERSAEEGFLFVRPCLTASDLFCLYCHSPPLMLSVAFACHSERLHRCFHRSARRV